MTKSEVERVTSGKPSTMATRLVPLSTRPRPLLGRNDGEGNYRLAISRASVSELIDQVFDAIRQYGLGNPLAVIAAVELGERIGLATVHQEVRGAVVKQLAALRNAYGSAEVDSVDADKCRLRIDAATSAITAKA